MRPYGKLWVSQALAGLVGELMGSRRTILPKRLVAPGPDPQQLQEIFAAAASAPDHGQVRPWRFILVPTEARVALAQVFAQALLERDPDATPEQRVQAQEKAHRSPCLMLVVVNTDCGDASIDWPERLISTGCAVQNMLLVATALGYGSALTSGKALKSAALRDLFALAKCEHALCFVSLGTIQSRKLSPRQRPKPEDYVSTLVLRSDAATS
nr:nitroreductase [uncultured Rhodoferax sp.]